MGLKDRFAARQRPRESFPLRMDFGEESEAAEREFTRAAAELAEARRAGWTDLGVLTRRVEQARVAREEFYEFLEVVALSPREFDDLVGEHPPTDDQRKKAEVDGRGKLIWNSDSFVPALLAACIESDMSGEDWAELTSKGPVASGEVGALFQAALQVNDRTPDPSVGKG